MPQLGAIKSENGRIDFLNNLYDAIDSTMAGPDRLRAHLAVRGVLGAEGLSEILPGPMNIVVQFVPIDLKSKVPGAMNEVKRELRDKHYAAGNAASIVCEYMPSTDLAARLDAIEANIRRLMEKNEGAKALIEIPLNLLTAEVKTRLATLMADPNIKVQVLEQDKEEYPDIMTFFELGIKLLDYERTGIKTQSLVNLLAYLCEPGQNIEDILKKENLFKLEKTLKIRKLDLKELHQAMEAMALVRQAL
ncbi:MAG: hypothetical protein PHS37_04255 [Candidatus Omnitrophica bacterium]|nr:hypothetical protein [Candidatus Omnitrophota bacterium]